MQYTGDVAKRTETEPAAPPPPPDPAPTGRRPRARRETAELTIVAERSRTQGFWGNRPPRAISEAVTMIAPAPAPKPTTTRAATVSARRPSTGADDFLDEAATEIRATEQ
jgi:hypothetical protein